MTPLGMEAWGGVSGTAGDCFCRVVVEWVVKKKHISGRMQAPPPITPTPDPTPALCVGPKRTFESHPWPYTPDSDMAT